MKNDEKLISEIKEFLETGVIDNTEEKIEEWYKFAEFQMEQDTYWSPCEDCDNPSCRKKDNFPMWFCDNQR